MKNTTNNTKEMSLVREKAFASACDSCDLMTEMDKGTIPYDDEKYEDYDFQFAYYSGIVFLCDYLSNNITLDELKTLYITVPTTEPNEITLTSKKLEKRENIKVDLKRLSTLGDLVAEAFDRVWLDRKTEEDFNDSQIMAKIQEVIDKYGIDIENDCDSYYHGYWSGILAGSRFFRFDFSQDALFLVDNSEGILDT